MHKRLILAMVIPILVVGAVGVAWIYASNPQYSISGFSQVERKARIQPDYSDITIPPNRRVKSLSCGGCSGTESHPSPPRGLYEVAHLASQAQQDEEGVILCERLFEVEIDA